MNNESTTCSYCEKEDAVEMRYDPILRRAVLACEQHKRFTVAQPPIEETVSRPASPLNALIPGNDAVASTARHIYRVIKELIDGPVYKVYSSELREDVGIKGPVSIKAPLALLQEAGLLKFNIVEVKKRHTCLFEIELTKQVAS